METRLPPPSPSSTSTFKLTMKPNRSSQTALRVALSRAAHQVLDTPRVLDDPIALRVVGDGGAAAIRAGGLQFESQFARSLRALFVARSRYAEDELALAVKRGVRQYVILGAGLDTFAYRNPYQTTELRVFEVDHPSTQAWKRQQLDAAAIAIPSGLDFVPVDFESDSLAERLSLAGFRSDEPTFFAWLGVSMYLTPDAVMATLKFVADTACAGGGIVFDYIAPDTSKSLLRRLRLRALRTWVSMVGEPWRAVFDPHTLSAALTELGFGEITDMGSQEINHRYFSEPAQGLAVRGPAHLLCARKPDGRSGAGGAAILSQIPGMRNFRAQLCQGPVAFIHRFGSRSKERTPSTGRKAFFQGS